MLPLEMTWQGDAIVLHPFHPILPGSFRAKMFRAGKSLMFLYVRGFLQLDQVGPGGMGASQKVWLHA